MKSSIAWDVGSETDYPENSTAWIESGVTGRDKPSEWIVELHQCQLRNPVSDSLL